jgi:hypothetical protein
LAGRESTSTDQDKELSYLIDFLGPDHVDEGVLIVEIISPAVEAHVQHQTVYFISVNEGKKRD